MILECDTTAQLANRVLHGKLHAAFGVLPLPEEGLWIKPIVREPFCLCVSKNHRLAKQPTVLAREMDGEIVFFLPRTIHPGLYDRTVEYIESTGAKPVLREVLSLTHTMEVVAHNFGVALPPHSASRFSYLGVLFKPVTDKLLWIETALFLRTDQRNDRTRLVLNTVLSHLRNPSNGVS